MEDHRHCLMCGRVVEKEKLFCSSSCEELFRKQQEKMRKARLLSLSFLLILLFIILLLSSLSPSS